jgi:flavorubredoxin
MAPMVHWPEVMVTFEATKKILFSADAFGSFGALDGNIFADEVDVSDSWISEMRRYYSNIVGKYGAQVQALLKKAAGLDIKMICPLHGLVWRKDLSLVIDKHQKWSAYIPEQNGVVIAYASIYGNTQNAVSVLSGALAEKGIKNIKSFDVSCVHPSYIISEIFRASHVVFASPTYNGGIFPNMETLLHDIKAHNVQNRTFGFMENGSWAPMAANLMKELLNGLKNISVIETVVSIKSALKKEHLRTIEKFADEIVAGIGKK